MSKVLLLLSSPRGEASVSTRVARGLAQAIVEKTPGATLAVRDLAEASPPHVDADAVAVITGAAQSLTARQQASADRSDILIGELADADTIVIGAAMINFAVTSQLKSWFDHVAVRGRTFRYTESGPEGLLKGKKAYVVLASAGVYSDGPAKAIDFAAPYIRHMLGFMGISDIEFVRVEGLAFGPDAADKAIGEALARSAVLATEHSSLEKAA